MTNRELYLRVAKVAARAHGAGRELEAYLRAVLGVCRGMREMEALTCEGFVEVLEAALTAEAVEVEAGWRSMAVQGLAGFAAFEGRLQKQVMDLREMRAAGVFENRERYFGVFAPSGARWYNFDVATFLECGAVGTFGGWEPGDEGDRELVPGEVAVMGEEGIEAVPAAEVERPVFAVGGVDWETLRMFLGMGQSYE